MKHTLNITETKKCCKYRPDFPDALVPRTQIIHTLVKKSLKQKAPFLAVNEHAKNMC